MSASLKSLLERLERADLLVASPPADLTLDIDHLAYDSRRVGPGGLFVAIRGAQSDGHAFLDTAVQNGAIALVCEAAPAALGFEPPAGVACIQASDTRAALAELATAFYDDPSHRMPIVGVTGTNGKTTTATLLHHALTALGHKTGLVGTVAYRIGDETIESTHTTPDALDLQALFARMAGAGCTACAMEVSSHALAQERVRGTRFAVGVFTNLTQDHLDYHETLEDYLCAKKRLFDRLDADAVAVYNRDDLSGARMVSETVARCVSYGAHEDADVRVEVLHNGVDGLRLRLDGHERRFRLVGDFNAYNLAAAYAACRALGHEAHDVLDALAAAPPVSGRFEQLSLADRTVVIDYAHTPDALENVLQTLRAVRPDGARLWCVFGCGGDRDRGKRPQMGRIAERLADRVVVTSDNPRTEDPEAILRDIREGLERPDEALWEASRAAAIRLAARESAPGDLVLIAGKGHETYQIVGTEKRDFDDRAHARQAFAELDGSFASERRA